MGTGLNHHAAAAQPSPPPARGAGAGVHGGACWGAPCGDKRSAGWPAEDGSPSRWVSPELKSWGGTGGNQADSEGRGVTQTSLLHAMQSLSGIPCASLNHPQLQQRAASFLEGHAATHLLPCLVEETSRGGGEVPRVHREEAAEPKVWTSASKTGLPSQGSTM